MSPKNIEGLLTEGGRYDVEILPELEKYLDEQLEKGTYDQEANLAILKLYLLYPKEVKVKVYENVLVKALTALPATDFALCMYQIPDKHHEQLKGPKQLADHLEKCKFKAFWKDAEAQIEAAKKVDEEAALSRAKGWEDAIRNFACGVVSSTYRSIRTDQLAELLNLPAQDVEKVIQVNGWTRSKEDKEVILVRADVSFEKARDEPKASATTGMSLDMYRQLFQASSGA